jgi:hypothetical protein
MSIRLTEITKVKCMLGLGAEGIKTFKPCLRLHLANLVVGVTVTRPRPVAKGVRNFERFGLKHCKIFKDKMRR